jgi:hypothetical protein
MKIWKYKPWKGTTFAQGWFWNTNLGDGQPYPRVTLKTIYKMLTWWRWHEGLTKMMMSEVPYWINHTVGPRYLKNGIRLSGVVCLSWCRHYKCSGSPTMESMTRVPGLAQPRFTILLFRWLGYTPKSPHRILDYLD